MQRQQRQQLRILDLNNITQGAVEQAVAAEYHSSEKAIPRTIRIENWQAPPPTGDFVTAFPGFAPSGRGRARAGGNEVEVTTEKISAGRVAVYLVPNTQNPTFQHLHGTIKLKVAEAQL
jgi:hypothetical protein